MAGMIAWRLMRVFAWPAGVIPRWNRRSRIRMHACMGFLSIGDSLNIPKIHPTFAVSVEFFHSRYPLRNYIHTYFPGNGGSYSASP